MPGRKTIRKMQSLVSLKGVRIRGLRGTVTLLVIILTIVLVLSCLYVFTRRRSHGKPARFVHVHHHRSSSHRLVINSPERYNSTWLILDGPIDDNTYNQFENRSNVHIVTIASDDLISCTSNIRDCQRISKLFPFNAFDTETGTSSILHTQITNGHESQSALTSLLSPAIQSKMAAVLHAISEGAKWIFVGGGDAMLDLNRLETVLGLGMKTGMVHNMPGFYHPLLHHYKHGLNSGDGDDDDDGVGIDDDGDDRGDNVQDGGDDHVNDSGGPEIKADRYDVMRLSGQGVYLLMTSCVTQKYCLHSNPPFYLSPGSWTSLPARPFSMLAHRKSAWFLIAAILGAHNKNHGNGSSDKTNVLIGLILQRLLWETNQMLAFMPSSPKTQLHSESGDSSFTSEFSRQSKNTNSKKRNGDRTGRTLKKIKVKSRKTKHKDCQYNISEMEYFASSQYFHQKQKEVIHNVTRLCPSTNISFYPCVQRVIETYGDTFNSNNNNDMKMKNGIVESLNLVSHWFKLLAVSKYKFPTRKPFQKRMTLQITAPKIPMWFTPSPCKPIQRFIRAKGSNGNQSPARSREENGTAAAAGSWTNLINKNLCQSSSWFQERVHQNFVPEKFKISDILLIIVFNYQYLASHIPLLLAMYGRHFRHILFCGENFPSFVKFYKMDKWSGVSFVEINHYEGTWGYSCMSAAVKMNYDVTGYLQMSDDVLLNVWNLEGLPRDRCWFQSRVRVANTQLSRVPDIATTNRWYPWIFIIGQKAANASLVTLKRLEKYERFKHMMRTFLQRLAFTTRCKTCLLYEASDIFYVPKTLVKSWALFADIFQANSVHLEIAIPTAIFGPAPEADVYRLRGNYVWGFDRADFQKYYSPYDHFQHAFKLSRLTSEEDAKFFCENYLSWIEKDLIRE